MSDPHVREVGRVKDIDGPELIVGTDYDTVAVTVLLVLAAHAHGKRRGRKAWLVDRSAL